MYRHGKVGYQTTHRYFVCQASQLITRPGYSTTGKLETNDDVSVYFVQILTVSGVGGLNGKMTWDGRENDTNIVEDLLRQILILEQLTYFSENITT